MAARIACVTAGAAYTIRYQESGMAQIRLSAFAAGSSSLGPDDHEPYLCLSKFILDGHHTAWPLLWYGASTNSDAFSFLFISSFFFFILFFFSSSSFLLLSFFLSFILSSVCLFSFFPLSLCLLSLFLLLFFFFLSFHILLHDYLDCNPA